MSAAAEGFPNWLLLEPYLFRRDKEDSFPDESTTPIRASAATSWGADFSIAFSVVEPPRISRLYAHMPGFPHPDKEIPLFVLATHRHLALLFVSSSEAFAQNFFIFRANEKNPTSCLLKLLPTCTLPEIDYSSGGGRLRPRFRKPSNSTPRPRLLQPRSLGLWCGDKEELVVAELTVCVSTLHGHYTKAFIDICLLRSFFTGDQLGGEWASMRVPILSTDNDDLLKLSRWQTSAIIPFQQWLCWVDYKQGILFCDVSSKVTTPTISFLSFPDKSPRISTPPTSTHKTTCNIFYSGVSVVDHGRLLKFVNVTCNDGLVYQALKPGASFTITCHTLILGDGSSTWKEDCTITSDDLRGHLPRGIPMYPQVDMDRPHVVHFLYIEFGPATKKKWVLSIDMSTKTVESIYLYMDLSDFRKNNLPIDEAGLIKSNLLSPTPWPFIRCEFPRFCNLSRKRKDME